MSEVDAIMNKSPVTDAVIGHWQEKASDRQTVVFCSTLDHAANVTAAFRHAGIKVSMIQGDMPDTERKSILAAYDQGDIQVIVNVAVLTEGWDHPPTSCVVLLRPSSYKSTMIQMVGRGFRLAPGKADCLVLDFGGNVMRHGPVDDLGPNLPDQRVST